MDHALAGILGTQVGEDPELLDGRATVLEGDALVLRGAAARLRARAELLRRHAAALGEVAEAEAGMASATLALHAALADAIQCGDYAWRAREVLLRTIPHGKSPRDQSIVYRAARVHLIWRNRLPVACGVAVQAIHRALAARDRRTVARERLDKAAAALTAATPSACRAG